MRLDPPDVIFGTITSLPLRLLAAWVVGSFGVATSAALGGFGVFLESFLWITLFYPFFLFFSALASGVWMLAILPLLLVLAWRVLAFLQGERCNIELIWIYVLSMLSTFRLSSDRWPLLVVLAIIVIACGIRLRRSLPPDPL